VSVMPAVTSSSSSFEGEAKAPATAFEMVDVLGLAQLVKRSGDLDGSVPLRVAQGCGPLFEGNAFGFQISLRQGITLCRTDRGVGMEIDAPCSRGSSPGDCLLLMDSCRRHSPTTS